MNEFNDTFLSEKIHAFHAWKPAAVIEARGPDAFSFLQGQFSNDLRRVSETGCVYGLWLDRKGKCLADSFVLKRDHGLFLVSYFSPASAILQTLESHLIADDAQFTNFTASAGAVTSFEGWSAPAGDALEFPGRRGRVAQERVYLSGSPSTDRGGCDFETMERLRFAGGIPAVPVDIGPGDFPDEGGLNADAVSYTKGCFLGQEVIARLKSLGQIRRRLVRIRGASAAAPSVGAKLYQGNRVVGEMRSSVGLPQGGFIGFAMLTLHLWKKEEGVAAGPDLPPAISVEAGL